jgi:NADH:ubiquinone oxidoreductase subunit 6 (subunit J)
MTPSILYTACVVGAIGLYLIMRPHRKATRIVGTIAGAGALAFIMVKVLEGLDADAPVPILEIIFGLAAITGAARMVTHPRPVFAAIYFVVVVVSSAGMFLLMDAEFMAFSLIIVYAGAILITYLFVLMLAQDATSTAGEAPPSKRIAGWCSTAFHSNSKRPSPTLSSQTRPTPPRRRSPSNASTAGQFGSTEPTPALM